MLHLLTGLYDAKLDGRPVVAVVGQVASTALGSGYLQSLSNAVCGQYVQTVPTPEQVPMLIDDAMSRTANGLPAQLDRQRADEGRG